MKENNLTRMLPWLLMAVSLYLLAMFVVTQPQLQTALWKAGHITVGSFVGYWVDRNLYGRVDFSSTDGRVLARSAIVAAAIIGMAFGL